MASFSPSMSVDPQIATYDLTPPRPEVPPQSDVDEFLRKKRKAREHKACYPCRQRKVKCDLTRPCQTCRDREHPELCSYHPPNKRSNGDAAGPALKVEDQSASSGHVLLGRAEFEMLCAKLSGLEHSIAELRREVQRSSADRNGHHELPLSAPSDKPQEPDPTARSPPLTHTNVHGSHTRNDAGEIVHLGPGSIPALLYGFGQGQAQIQYAEHLQELLGKSVLPLFGLDNESATYPFVDLWGLPHASLARAEGLAKAIPSDAQVWSTVQQYRTLIYVVYPGIPSFESFGEELQAFLVERANSSSRKNAVTEHMIYGKSYCWLGVLFGLLAGGTQCGNTPRKERELTSQVYICCSMECLRFTNFLSQPHIENIQALLLIGSTMANNMNAGTAWALLGLTIRLAQGLGLHRHCPPNTPREIAYVRSRVWWALIWHDSLLSIAYDRASSTAAVDVNTMPMPQEIAPDSVSPFHATMYRLTKCGLDIVHDRYRIMDPREVLSRIKEHEAHIARLLADTTEYLRDSRKCTSLEETLEHWGLYLHSSYVLSEVYRPALSRSGTTPDLDAFKPRCVENLGNTVEAYLGLNNITINTRSSWAATHRALNSALMLGIVGEHRHSDRARGLIARLITIMDQITAAFDPQEITAPVQRAISALRKLNIAVDGSLRPATSLAASGSVADEEAAREQYLSAMISPSSGDTPVGGDDASPYSILNTILWGGSAHQTQHPELLMS